MAMKIIMPTPTLAEGDARLMLVAVAIVALAMGLIVWRQTSDGTPDNPSPTRMALFGAILVGLAAGIVGAYLLNAGWAN